MSLKRLEKKIALENKVDAVSAVADNTLTIVSTGFDTTISTAINNKVEDINSAVTEISEIVDLPQRITDLESELLIAKNSISSVAGQLLEVDAAVSGYSTFSSDFVIQVEDLEEQLAQVKSSISLLDTRMLTAEASLSSVADTVVVLTSNNSVLSANLDSLKGSFGSIVSDFMSLKTRVSLVENATGSITNSFNLLSNNVDELELEVSSLETIANQALTKANEALTKSTTVDFTVGDGLEKVSSTLQLKVDTNDFEFVSGALSLKPIIDTTLTTRIADEEAARAAGDTTTLNSAKAYTDTQIASIVDSAPAVLNTLKELSTALNNDSNFSTTITNQITTTKTGLETLIATEMAKATAAGEALDARLDTLEGASTVVGSVAYTVKAEETRAKAEEAKLATDLATEVTARQSADTTLQTNITAEETARIAADTTTLTTAKAYTDTKVADVVDSAPTALNTLKKLATAINNDAAFSTTIDTKLTTLQTNLTAETTARTAANTTLDTAIKAEETARISADNNLQTSISNEVTRATAAETALQNNITAEATARASGDTSTLSSAKAYTDTKVADLVDSAPALLDTLNELAAAIADDPNFATTITGQISGVQTNLTSEVTRATAAEGALDTRLDTLEADATVTGSVAFKVKQEETRATTAESNLQTAINSEATTRAQADTALSGRVSALESNFSVTVITTGTSATAAAGETVIIALATPSAFSVSLPIAPAMGTRITIKDGNGVANVNNISVLGNGKTIDGFSGLVLKEKYSFVSLVYNGTQWNIVGLLNTENLNYAEAFLLIGAV